MLKINKFAGLLLLIIGYFAYKALDGFVESNSFSWQFMAWVSAVCGVIYLKITKKI